MKKIKILVVLMAIVFATPSFAQFTSGVNKSRTTNSRSTTSSIEKGYKGMFDIGYGLGVGDLEGTNRVGFATTHGYQFNPYVFTGVGLGLNYYHEVESINIPIFANVRATMPIKSIAPFFDFRIGYSAGDVSGLYLSPSVGIRAAIGNKAGLTFSLGYEVQKCETYNIGYSGGYYYDYYDTGNAGAVTFRLGIDF